MAEEIRRGRVRSPGLIGVTHFSQGVRAAWDSIPQNSRSTFTLLRTVRTISWSSTRLVSRERRPQRPLPKRLLSRAPPPQSGTVTIASPEVTLVLTASTTSNTGLDFEVAAGNDNNERDEPRGGDRAKRRGCWRDGNLGGRCGDGNGTGGRVRREPHYPHKRLDTFHIGRAATLLGGLGTASIVAFNNLYSTQGSIGGLCTQNGPSVYWSYFTGTGTASTSVVLSEDGTKVAYVESAATGAILHVLQVEGRRRNGRGLSCRAGHHRDPGRRVERRLHGGEFLHQQSRFQRRIQRHQLLALLQLRHGHTLRGRYRRQRA